MSHAFLMHTGTTYIQVNQALLVVAGACAFSTASAFIMFPAMYYYYGQALEVYDYHRIDGVGHPHNIVLQGFIRFTSFAFFPVIISATMLYLLVSEERFIPADVAMFKYCSILCAYTTAGECKFL